MPLWRTDASIALDLARRDSPCLLNYLPISPAAMSFPPADIPFPLETTSSLIYAVLVVRISESPVGKLALNLNRYTVFEGHLPASRMDMVAQRKSLPQAVPNSICIYHILVESPPKSKKTSSQGQPSENTRGISSLGHENGSGSHHVRCCH